jgi:DNA-binding transcriptional ArsR family regulator
MSTHRETAPRRGGHGGDADLAAVAALVAEPARARILLALGDGRSLPASVLAAEAGVAPSTASSHLAQLVGGGLLTVTPNGRHRYYRLAGPQVGRLIETLAGLAPTRPVRSLRDGTRAAALRRGRTCYDHLAGKLGVDLFDALLDRGYLTGGDGRHRGAGGASPFSTTGSADASPGGADMVPGGADMVPGGDRFAAVGHDVDYRLTPTGRDHLAGLGVQLPAPAADGTHAVRYCVDWTEQRHHLAGALGRAVAARFLAAGWLTRTPARRVVRLTDTGRTELAHNFGIATMEH